VTFGGPLADVDDADDCVQGLRPHRLLRGFLRSTLPA
jgi:hypothetical protein